MAPKKVNLRWISNESTRRATFKKRQANLMKKTNDLTMLCGIKACLVMYGEGKLQPDVWPSIPEANHLVDRFNSMPDHLVNYKKTVSQEDFLRNRISYVRHQVAKSDYKNSERETSFLLYQTMSGQHPGLIGLSREDLTRLRDMVETKMKVIKERFPQLVVGQGQSIQEQPPEPMLFSPQQQAPPTYATMQIPMLAKEHHPKHDSLQDLIQQNSGMT